MKNSHSVGFLQKEKLKNTVKHQHNFPNKHHCDGVPFAPPTALIQWIAPIWRMGGHQKWFAKGSYAKFCLIW